MCICMLFNVKLVLMRSAGVIFCLPLCVLYLHSARGQCLPWLRVNVCGHMHCEAVAWEQFRAPTACPNALTHFALHVQPSCCTLAGRELMAIYMSCH